MQTYVNYHEKGMEIHSWEAAKMQSIRAVTETDMAKALSQEEAEKSKNNASAY